jgi:hypothetical protein
MPVGSLTFRQSEATWAFNSEKNPERTRTLSGFGCLIFAGPESACIPGNLLDKPLDQSGQMYGNDYVIIARAGQEEQTLDQSESGIREDEYWEKTDSRLN